jgi:hypothetical protein
MSDPTEAALLKECKRLRSEATLAREAGFREGVEAAKDRLTIESMARERWDNQGSRLLASCVKSLDSLSPPPPTTPASGNEKKEDQG